MRKLLKLFGRGTTGAALGVFVTAVGCEPRKKAADSPSGALSQARGPGMAELAVNVMPRELVSQNAASSILSRWEREVDFDVSSAYMSSLPVDVAVSSALEGSSYPFK